MQRRGLVFGLVFILPPFLKKVVLRWLCGAKIGPKATIGWLSSVMGSNIEIGQYCSIKPLTLIRCDGEVKLGNYTEVSSFSLIYGCGNFQTGDKCYIGPQSLINLSEDVVLGSKVGIGPRTMIFTHGSFLPYTEGYPVRFGKVTVGDNVWMAAGVFVHPGVIVGDNVFVNSRSVITENIPSGQAVEGFPAKPVMKMDMLQRRVTPTIKDKLIAHIFNHYISFLVRTRRGIEIGQSSKTSREVRVKGRDYRIILVGSEPKESLGLGADESRKIIILSNRVDLKPEIYGSAVVFDFVNLKTQYSRDELCRELNLFFKQYYGIVFEFGPAEAAL